MTDQYWIIINIQSFMLGNFTRKFLMNELAEIFDEFLAIDLFDDFFEESEDHELHGDALGYAALHHIEELFFVYVTSGGTVRATHVVG